jgi:hypothetical protein
MHRSSRITQGLHRGLMVLLSVVYVVLGGPPGSDAQRDDPTAKRQATLRAIALAYFDGLAQHDLSQFPYDDTIHLRAPLNPQGGAESPIVGRNNVLAYFAKVLPAIGPVRVRDTYLNEALTIVCAEATVGVITPVVHTTLRVADCFTVNAVGKVTEQENHFDPRAVTHPQKFTEITRSYFSALASDNPEDLKSVPWADDVKVRAPLYPGGAEVEFVGRAAMEGYLKPFLPVIGTVDVLLNTLEGEWVCTKANIGLPDASNPASRIRVTDCFHIDPMTGKIIAQENHYDPRPAMPPCASCGGTATHGCTCP